MADKVRRRYTRTLDFGTDWNVAWYKVDNVQKIITGAMHSKGPDGQAVMQFQVSAAGLVVKKANGDQDSYPDVKLVDFASIVRRKALADILETKVLDWTKKDV